MPDSTVTKQWIKNIWVKQVSRSMWQAPNQKMVSSLGMVEVDRTKSLTANMHRKKYMGWCRLLSNFTKARMVTFPTTANRYMELRGMESQMCKDSSPGMPVSQKEVSTKQALLASRHEHVWGFRVARGQELLVLDFYWQILPLETVDYWNLISILAEPIIKKNSECLLENWHVFYKRDSAWKHPLVNVETGMLTFLLLNCSLPFPLGNISQSKITGSKGMNKLGGLLHWKTQSSMCND